MGGYGRTRTADVGCGLVGGVSREWDGILGFENVHVCVWRGQYVVKYFLVFDYGCTGCREMQADAEGERWMVGIVDVSGQGEGERGTGRDRDGAMEDAESGEWSGEWRRGQSWLAALKRPGHPKGASWLSPTLRCF